MIIIHKIIIIIIIVIIIITEVDEVHTCNLEQYLYKIIIDYFIIPLTCLTDFNNKIKHHFLLQLLFVCSPSPSLHSVPETL